MPSDLIQGVFSSVWAIILIVFFFGGSIFVHELGHFLAARWRGLKVLRFSIGFGHAIWKTRRNGVDYTLRWIPFGGYVSVPQLADMQGIEGVYTEKEMEAIKDLPPGGYWDKVITLAAGAFFNILFAMVLATILWITGYPSTTAAQSTKVGSLAETIIIQDRETGERHVPGPAANSGLELGDKVIAIDGKSVKNFTDIRHAVVTGKKQTDDGEPLAVFTVDRDGNQVNVAVEPLVVGDTDKLRHIGMGPGYVPVVHRVIEKSPAEKAGVQSGDRILKIDGIVAHSAAWATDYIAEHSDKEIQFTLSRGDTNNQYTATLKPEEVIIQTDGTTASLAGFALGSERVLVRMTPIEQFVDVVDKTFATLGALISPKSNIGISNMNGPIGIGDAIFQVSFEIRYVLYMVILININLAILNLLPIPVLDGGHIVFATFQKLSGIKIPPGVILKIQGTFMLLLLGMMLYVSFFDVNRVKDRVDTEAEFKEEQAARVPKLLFGDENPLNRGENPYLNTTGDDDSA